MSKVIVLDCETTNSLEEPLCYDIGWAVVESESGEVVKTQSFAVAEIFLDKDLMSFAYFADKIPQYWDEIKSGIRKLARLSTIYFALKQDCIDYEINEIYAHNARFDYHSLTLTQRFVTCSKYRYFIPYGIRVCDTLKMSRQAFKDDENYQSYCKANNYMTARGQVRYTAEILYRFMTNDDNFEEIHKGIDDVLIEKEILRECIARGITNGALFN